MADELIGQVADLLEGQIDFEGQRVVDLLAKVFMSMAALMAFGVGYWLQDITLALRVGLFGTALAFFAIVPPWPLYKRHPIKWYSQGAAVLSKEGL